MKWTYLLIDFFSVLVPFIFSFYPGINFYRNWKSLFPAVFLTGLLFLVWDAFFTKIGVWGFNPQYLLGYKIYNLPIEEVLFFICIPYACIFSYHCLAKFLTLKMSPFTEKTVTLFLIFAAVLFGIIFHNRYYTAWTSFFLAFLLLLVKYVFRVSWLGKFYRVYLFLLIPFLIVNGLLTGTGLKNPVVWYNNAENLSVRILTIPVEDIFYGMGLILTNLVIYKSLLKKNVLAYEI